MSDSEVERPASVIFSHFYRENNTFRGSPHISERKDRVELNTSLPGVMLLKIRRRPRASTNRHSVSLDIQLTIADAVILRDALNHWLHPRLDEDLG